MCEKSEFDGGGIHAWSGFDPLRTPRLKLDLDSRATEVALRALRPGALLRPGRPALGGRLHPAPGRGGPRRPLRLKPPDAAVRWLRDKDLVM